MICKKCLGKSFMLFDGICSSCNDIAQAEKDKCRERNLNRRAAAKGLRWAIRWTLRGETGWFRYRKFPSRTAYIYATRRQAEIRAATLSGVTSIVKVKGSPSE